MPNLNRLALASLTFVVLCLGSATTARADPLTIYSTGQQGAVLIAINAQTGSGAVIGSLGITGAAPLASHPNGALYTVANAFPPTNPAIEQLATINPATGQATLVGSPFPFRVGVMPLAFSSTGILYAEGNAPGGTFINSLLTINLVTGQPILVGSLGVPGMMDFAFHPNGTLYGATQTALYTINTNTGAATLVHNFSGVSMVMGITFDPSGNLFATTFSSTSSLFSVNPTTGAATLIGNIGVPFVHSADVNSVPEPATMLLLGTGLLGLASRVRKRKSSFQG